ncbi:MAG: hypothetical protein JNK04_12985 [Myxococcales bacterium]|nr:hypothetical protein [Myxococcales bacterium]
MEERGRAETLVVKACRLGDFASCLEIFELSRVGSAYQGVDTKEVLAWRQAGARRSCERGVVRGCSVADPDKHSYKEWLELMCADHDVSACRARATAPTAQSWGDLEKYMALENEALWWQCEHADDASACSFYASHADRLAEERTATEQWATAGLDRAKAGVAREKAARLFAEQCDLGFPPSCSDACLALRDADPPRAKEYLARACALGDKTACKRAELGWPWR